MDTSRLRQGELIAGVAGALLLVIMFLNWFGAPDEVNGLPTGANIAEAAGFDTSFSAWQAFDFIDIILFITAIVAVGLAVMTATARTVALPVAASAITAGLGILSTLLVLYRIIDPPFELDRKYGVFLGLIAAAAIAYGGWRAMQEEGTSFSREADRLQDQTSGPGDRPPPPPPPPPSTGTGTGTGTGAPPGGPTV
jgi:hypothetical protein